MYVKHKATKKLFKVKLLTNILLKADEQRCYAVGPWWCRGISELKMQQKYKIFSFTLVEVSLEMKLADTSKNILVAFKIPKAPP